MGNSEAVRTYLISEVESLEPFDLVLIAPINQPLHVAELTRTEEGALETRIPGRPPILPPLDLTARQALSQLEFKSDDPADASQPWVRAVADAEEAVELLQRIFTEVFEEKPGVKLNIMHGSHRIEHEASQKLAIARERIETVVSDILGRRADQDDDHDYILPIGQVQINVAPRATPNGEIVVRVFAITNVGFEVTPELGLFLARLNFGMMFGRFALDTAHRAIWFDETLLGEEFREEELRFVIRMIATTADDWDDRLKQMFGGVTYQEVQAGLSAEKLPKTKPGEGPGMYL